MSERDFDVVVFGATGVTGRRVAAYLHGRAGQVGARWAAAGRDERRVREVLATEGVHDAATVVADVADPGSLRAMTERTRVVLDLVGPYTLYGRPVIEACVAGGAHYADLTGEIPFVRQMMDVFHAQAERAGVKIVQVCGFEALPPDLAVALAARAAREHHDEELVEADLSVTVLSMAPGRPRVSDALSGGTLQSIAEITAAEESGDLSDPAVLISEPGYAGRVRDRSPIRVAPRRRADGAVLAPMVPAAYINPAVIHRTCWLQGREPLRYREGIALPGRPATLPLRYAAAGALSATQVGLGALLGGPASVRGRLGRVLRRGLPGSGFGPSTDRMQAWRWRMDVDGRTSGGRTVAVEVEGDGHPGYLTTARAMGEAGLLLAAPDATPQRGGCVTPSVALGTDELERFAAAGLRFSVGTPA